MSNKTVDFLFELGCEEIPARFLGALSDAIKTDLLSALEKLHIGYNVGDDADQVTVFYTYRRLAVRIQALHAMQQDQLIQYQGPPVAVAKDKAGQWTPAALGFAKKCGVSPDQLQTIADAKGRDCLYYELMQKGQPVQTCLPELIRDVIYSIHLPIAMRWGSETQPFFRTVQWICCLCDSLPIDVTVWDVTATNQSFGHRFLTSNSDNSIDGKPITISSPAVYEAVLKDHFVMVDPQKRREIITKALNNSEGPPGLVDEVNGLVEWPTALTMTFDDRYLSLPDEVLVQVMVKHQKYFPIWDNGHLTHQCIVIADNVTGSNQQTIIDGNQRVIHARFSDALYFWETDCKKPLKHYVSQLDKVVFQKGLGTLLDKTNRLQQLVMVINETYSLKLKETILKRAAFLCKADLVTQMVCEFPILQGVMGFFYAKKTEDDAVSMAIRDHYLPAQSKGKVPDTEVGAVLAIADRMDTIVACYVNGQLPTSSKDPMGLRRAMLGILVIMDQFQWSINLEALIDLSYGCFDRGGSKEFSKDQLMSFFLLRIKYYMMEAGISYDIAEAVLSSGMTDFLGSLNRARGLMDYANDEVAYKRLIDAGVGCIRLVKERSDTNGVTVNVDLFEHESEGHLFNAIKVAIKSTEDDPPDQPQLDELVFLVPMIESYFDSVLVMADDESVRCNRLLVIDHVATRFKSFAQFEGLVK